MNIKVVNRYVELMVDIIDVKVRNNGKDVSFDKNYIISVLRRYQFDDTPITDKIFKDTVKWFKEKYLFETVGKTSNLRYKLHPNFKYKVSKDSNTVLRQCRFIIGQLFLFNDVLWDKSESLYEDVIKSDEFFQLLPTIRSNVVKDTITTLLIHSHNEVSDGKYPYDILLTLFSSKTPFDIEIKNDAMSVTMKNVVLKKIVFNTDTVSVTLNNSQLELNSLSDIIGIKIVIPNDIYDRIDNAIEYLKKHDDETIKEIKYFLNEYKSKNEIFFQNILEEK